VTGGVKAVKVGYNPISRETSKIPEDSASKSLQEIIISDATISTVGAK
jgi:hypothetical protein